MGFLKSLISKLPSALPLDWIVDNILLKILKSLMPQILAGDKKVGVILYSFGHKYGLRISTLARKKFGAKWEVAETVFQEKIQKFFDGFHDGLNQDD